MPSKKKVNYDVEDVGVDEYSILQEIDSQQAYDELASSLIRHGNMTNNNSW